MLWPSWVSACSLLQSAGTVLLKVGNFVSLGSSHLTCFDGEPLPSQLTARTCRCRIWLVVGEVVEFQSDYSKVVMCLLCCWAFHCLEFEAMWIKCSLLLFHVALKSVHVFESKLDGRLISVKHRN